MESIGENGGIIMFHNVVQVVPCEDYKVYVYFEDEKLYVMMRQDC